MNADELKRQAAEHSVEIHVRSGQRLGLGTGSTAAHVVRAIGRRVRSGELSELRCVPTSEATGRLAASLGITLTSLAETPVLDLAIDGADEVAPDLALTKGLGGAALRERIVARAATIFVVVADHSKRVSALGERARIPVETVQFAAGPVFGWLTNLELDPELRSAADGSAYVTDEGNWIYDCATAPLPDPAPLARALDELPGVVGHGIFLGLTDVAYLAGPSGIETLRRD